jgi:8-oxo-dGTP pyrophosphatase MutT (NUDIX family)
VASVKFVDAVAGLEHLPAKLPEPPDSLMPVRVAGEPWKAPAEGIAGARAAAVLILIAPDDEGQARVVLIERSTYDGHHSGEMSFPGGGVEAGDADVVATALREAGEEIGLEPEEIGLRVLGQLEPFWIPVSNFRVTPVIAIAERLPAWRADPREVKTVVNAPVAAFLPDAPIRIIERDVRAWRIRYGAYALDELGDGPAVWGATARFLGQLGALLGAATKAPEMNGTD